MEVEFGDIAPPEEVHGKTYHVREIDGYSAKRIVERFHYSHKVVSNSKLHLGIFSNETKRIVGCLSFGPLMNGDRTSTKIHPTAKMFELNRMVMTDDEPRNAESQAIGLCIKWLKRFSDVGYLLSFSDGKQGNVGYIYQATNWLYIGYLLSDSFYELDGDVVHNVTVWHKYKEKHPLRNTHTTNEILCKYHNNVSRILSKQHVYLFPLKKLQFSYDTIQFPKKDVEVPILKRTWIQKDGVQTSEVETYTDEKLSAINFDESVAK